jgi:cell division protein FtsZ
MVQESAHEEANIIFGVVTDASMGDMVKVTVIATGFDAAALQAEQARNVRSSVSSYPTNSPAHRPSALREPVRNALQMRANPERPSMQPARPSRMPQQAQMEQALVAATRPSGFGPSALHDERVLDIPAYLRRGGSNSTHE